MAEVPWYLVFDDIDKRIEALRKKEQKVDNEMIAFEPLYGKWEEADYFEPDWHGFGIIRIPKGGLLCTQCRHVYKKDLLFDRSKCPNCGRDMRLKEE